MLVRLLFAIMAIFVLSLNFACGAGGEAFTDASKAGPDFAVQGEYKGELTGGGSRKPAGLQVIAYGDGAFEAVLFHGGLPGDGWKRGDKKESAKGKLEAGALKFGEPLGTGKLEGNKLTLVNSANETIGSFEKVERKSPSLGAKPPEGAIVLFDGSNVDEFPGATMTEDKLLLAGAMSKREFADFILHLEFRTPFMPKSKEQARGNSGVYLQNRYEIQVLDSFGLDGKNNECGGLYSLKEPAVNMCLPPLSWQTYDVDFTAARFDGDRKLKNARATVKHNGVVIYDDVEFPDKTPGGADKEAPGRGPFQLQQHGNPVTYRNIWVVEKK